MRNILIALIATVAAALLSLPPREDSVAMPLVQHAGGSNVGAMDLIRRQPGFFVPNLGQWQHAAKFVHRSGPMTLFLEDRGWTVDIAERSVRHEPRPFSIRQAKPANHNVEARLRGVAVRMTFAGNAYTPTIVGEKKLAGHHNYFLADDENRWRTDVPLYGSVRYENLYPGIDLRLREANGVPEYDLLLEPGADLAAVTVHVEGGQGLLITSDGSLVIETELGPLTQSVPKTWQVGSDGGGREVICNFRLLGADRFGFEAPGWDGDASLTIDPGLIWSTFLGGSHGDAANAVSVDVGGVVTVAGHTQNTNFPTTLGAYDTTYNAGPTAFLSDVFVSRLDPSKIGTAQLVYSTFLGGSGNDFVNALAIDASGGVTVAGVTYSGNFPTTTGAFDPTFNGVAPYYPSDVFVSRLDPSKTGAAQLVYSTYLGGGFGDEPDELAVDALGVVTVAGWTHSTDFPTTSRAYDTTINGVDAFVSRLDPSKTGAAQLVYSTFLGGSSYEYANALSVDASGVVTVAGHTESSDFPTTSGAYDTSYNGQFSYHGDVFVSRLDPRKAGAAQLVYSTFLGGDRNDYATTLSVDARGVVTVAGFTRSTNFPTSSGAYDTTHNGGTNPYLDDVFVSRLDPTRTGAAQLVYSTFLGGSGDDAAFALAVDASGVVTVAGWTQSHDFPTTRGAYDTTYNGPAPAFGGDAFVSRLDSQKTGSAQLVYSTFFGGRLDDYANALSVDASGVATVVGSTGSSNFPATSGAYDSTFNGAPPHFFPDAIVSRLDMGVALYGDVHAISIGAGGTQKLTVNADKAHANRLYWIFGSVTGTTPGLNLLGVHVPLNPDLYTDIAMVHVNSTAFTSFRGTLDANGVAAASLVVPANLPLPAGFTFYHAYVVYDASGKFYMASNAVPLTLRR